MVTRRTAVKRVVRKPGAQTGQKIRPLLAPITNKRRPVRRFTNPVRPGSGRATKAKTPLYSQKKRTTSKRLSNLNKSRR